MFCDSHCHLDSYASEKIAVLLEQARAKQVGIIITMGSNIERSEMAVRLAQSNPGVFAAVGIHPWNAVRPTEEIRRQLRELARQDKVVAIGEIGLDYARSSENKETQKELLRYQLSLAAETGLPVNIHCREAYQDMIDILHQNFSQGMKGIVHGFSGDVLTLKNWLSLGFYISIGFRGFINDPAPSLPAAILQIPLDHLITETDSVAGGNPAGPADVVIVAEKIASLRKATPEEIGNTAAENLKLLLNL